MFRQLQFENQLERLEKYSSAFLELSYCKLGSRASLKKKLKTKNLPNWQNDSLYVYCDEIEHFYDLYHQAFNLTTDDLFVVKYYSPADIDPMITAVNSRRPTAYQILVDWLNEAKNFNGFYLLGI